ncbi:MAG: bifunctional phosphoglucose/phosphomannose isomerase [Armatimonadota bacterium]|nr:bifunctional phosphoglucose/phosphomannose isomerase [Armatimonadota bacterium]MDR7537333.1 bifunctional phosphoglucose/phosphomannose isomerase [Armatimonadota bacterium]
MIDLDDAGVVRRGDPAGMLDLVLRLGPMVPEGWDAGGEVALPARAPRLLAVAGLGGSGIGGDLLEALLAPSSAVPVVVVRATRLPACVDAAALVLACSYSGDTAETLAAFDDALGRKAAVVAITSGGALAARARRGGVPVVAVRPGLPPRAALPLLFLPMLRLASRLGLTPVTDAEVREAAELLGRLAAAWGPSAPTGGNAAKHLAVRLHDALPVIYAATPALAPVAYRWKTQLNENAKLFAIWNRFPEASHNEVEAWPWPPPGAAAVVLRDGEDGARAAREVDAVRRLLAGRVRWVEEVWTQGDGRLARLLSLVLLGDLTSVYAALLRGVDPTPVEAIAAVKRWMQEAPRSQGTSFP